MSKTFAGYLSMFGTLIAVCVIGAAYGDAGSLWSDIAAFLTGRGDGIPRIHEAPPSDFVAGSLFLAALSVICAIASLSVVQLFLGSARERPYKPTLKPKKDVKIFRALFLLVLAEELFARGLFLGLLRQVPVFSGPVGLYLLFFLGNGIWALLHLGNYFFEEDKHPLRVLPQFIGGVFDTVAFLKWGLFGAVLVHFTHNAIVFATNKREGVGAGWFVHVMTHVLMLAVSLIGLQKPLGDVGAWLSGGRIAPLAGWSLGDYAWLLLAVSSALSLATTMLLYDQTRLKDGSLRRLGLGKAAVVLLISLAVAAVFVPLVSYLAYWCIGLFTDDTTFRIIGACMLMALFGSTDSLSRAMRSYWSYLTYTFLFLCVVATLGIGPAIQVTFYVGLAGLPAILILWSFPAGEEDRDLRDVIVQMILSGRRSRP
ncbi:MAG TPA: CPBP family intramembrane glutamic endopeptidase [Patescibacteria group bacterium]|nr:CPBP family intramembrane glutamic endopeptidase [Patescibacteria group bacterium]